MHEGKKHSKKPKMSVSKRVAMSSVDIPASAAYVSHAVAYSQPHGLMQPASRDDRNAIQFIKRAHGVM
jgi:hypothetical protein